MPSNDKIDCFVSVICPLINQKSLLSRLKGLHSHLNSQFVDFEIILVDINSSDGTLDEIDSLLAQFNRIRYNRITAAANPSIAYAAGLETAIGDQVATHDLLDPAEVITEASQLCLKGNNIIVGVSETRHSLGYRIVRPTVNWLLKVVNYNTPSNATTFRLLSRKAVNAVLLIGRHHHHFSSKITNTGYQQKILRYQSHNSHQTITLASGAHKCIRLMVFNSTKPLRWMSALGFFGSGMGFVFGAYSVGIHLFKGQVAEGWTSTILIMSFLFMILFVILAFFGEYLGRFLDEKGDHKDYLLVQEKNSETLSDSTLINTTDAP